MNSGAHTSGSFAAIQTVSAKDGGTWKTGTAYVKDGGAWKPWLVGGGGGSPGGASITNQLQSRNTTTPTAATAQYVLNSSGQAQRIDDDGTTNISGEWLVSGAASDYEVRATVNSGSLTSGPTGSWESLGTTRTWTLTRASVGTSSCVLLVEIRRVSDSVVVTSATIDFFAYVDSGM